MEPTQETNIIEFPPKTASVTDFAFQSLEEMEDEVSHFFPKEDNPELVMHMTLVSALAHRLLCEGMCKHKLRDFMLCEIDEAQELKDKIDEDAWNQNEMEEEEF